MPRAIQMLTRKSGPTVLGRNQTTSFFKRNKFYILYWSWNYRDCWHQILLTITRHGCPVLLFLVTTFLCQDWVICAPAAFLGVGSRFTGSLSPESNPNSLLPVTAMVGQYPTVES